MENINYYSRSEDNSTTSSAKQDKMQSIPLEKLDKYWSGEFQTERKVKNNEQATKELHDLFETEITNYKEYLLTAGQFAGKIISQLNETKMTSDEKLKTFMKTAEEFHKAGQLSDEEFIALTNRYFATEAMLIGLDNHKAGNDTSFNLNKTAQTQYDEGRVYPEDIGVETDINNKGKIIYKNTPAQGGRHHIFQEENDDDDNLGAWNSSIDN